MLLAENAPPSYLSIRIKVRTTTGSAGHISFDFNSLTKVICLFTHNTYLVLVNQLSGELYDSLYALALQLLDEGKSTKELETQLLKTSDDIVMVTVVIKEAKNAHFTRLRKEGFRLLIVGCIFGLSGFLITCINFYTNRSIEFAMFGLTSIGITLVSWGLYKIIG